MLDLDTQIFPPPYFNVVLSLEKLCHAVATGNEQSNLQSTLSKGEEGASLAIFVTDYR